MRTMVLAVLTAMVFCGCDKSAEVQSPQSSKDESAPPTSSTSTRAPVVQAAPAPGGNAAAKVESPAPNAPTASGQLAPDGVFYLIAPVSIETDAGIRSLVPGTGVKRVREGVYQTPQGELPIATQYLTNDLAIARAARDAAVNTQATLQNRAATAKSAASDRQKVANQNADAEKKLKEAAAAKTAMADKVAALRVQKVSIEAQIEVLSRKVTREQDGRDSGRSVTSNSSTQLTAARAQLKLVKEQISEIEREMPF